MVSAHETKILHVPAPLPTVNMDSDAFISTPAQLESQTISSARDDSPRIRRYMFYALIILLIMNFSMFTTLIAIFYALLHR